VLELSPIIPERQVAAISSTCWADALGYLDLLAALWSDTAILFAAGGLLAFPGRSLPWCPRPLCHDGPPAGARQPATPSSSQHRLFLIHADSRWFRLLRLGVATLADSGGCNHALAPVKTARYVYSAYLVFAAGYAVSPPLNNRLDHRTSGLLPDLRPVGRRRGLDRPFKGFGSWTPVFFPSVDRRMHAHELHLRGGSGRSPLVKLHDRRVHPCPAQTGDHRIYVESHPPSSKVAQRCLRRRRSIRGDLLAWRFM